MLGIVDLYVNECKARLIDQLIDKVRAPAVPTGSQVVLMLLVGIHNFENHWP